MNMRVVALNAVTLLALLDARYPISYDDFAGAVASSQATTAANAACLLLTGDVSWENEN